MSEFGIWSDAVGGFVEVGYFGEEGRLKAEITLAEACEGERVDLIDSDEADVCSVVEICSEHEEQPALGCEVCEDES